MADVLIILGSKSDAKKMSACGDVLDSLGVSWKITVCSAHRTPDRVGWLISDAEKLGVKIFICAAGMAAHLAGAFAARTVRPVIGIPLAASALGGQDALFSTVQMPAGIPVATVALDEAGAANAAWLACEILALNDETLKARLLEQRQAMRKKVELAAAELEGVEWV